jgi:hypothetical protein
MKVQIVIENIVGRYHVTVAIPQGGISAREQELINEFGDLLIEVGGNFTGTETRPSGGGPIAVDFDLPLAQRRLTTDFPVREIFDLEDDAESDVKAKVWGDTIKARIVTAKATLLSQASDFVGEDIETI